jgi:KRAB domain-containing zinc finger protein
LSQYNKLVIENARVKNVTKRQADTSTNYGTNQKQPKLEETLANANMVTQARMDELITKFVIEGVLPLSIVSLQAFKEMIIGLQPNRSVMSRAVLRTRIMNKMNNLKGKLIDILREQQFLATTADCWSAFGKSYMGVTVHWIDRGSFERKSACLALRRMKGKHTYDVIANALQQIHKEFAIEGKILRTTTDSGSNFVKAFHVFGEHKQSANDNNDEQDEDYENSEDNEDLSEIEGINVTDTFMLVDDSDEFSLPHHQRCSCHLLNLIATNDSKAAESDAQYKKLSRAAFAKCSALWNKFGRSTLASESVNESLGLGLKRPNLTRWNSTYMAVERLVQLTETKGEDVMNTVCVKLDLPKFSRSEFAFLRAYITAMAPLAKALNILQSEKKMFFGYLVPTLISLRDQLTNKYNSIPSNTCKPLIRALLDGLENRFEKVMNDEEIIGAAIIHAKFKNTWTDDDGIINKGIQYLKAALSTMANANAVTNHTNVPNQNNNIEDDDDENFFINRRRLLPISTDGIVDQFLNNNSTDVASVAFNPLLKDLFIKLNTPLPASAAVERLFSCAGFTMSKKRSSMSDELFENLVFLKCNMCNVEDT